MFRDIPGVVNHKIDVGDVTPLSFSTVMPFSCYRFNNFRISIAAYDNTKTVNSFPFVICENQGSSYLQIGVYFKDVKRMWTLHCPDEWLLGPTIANNFYLGEGDIFLMYSYGEAVSSRFGPQRSQLKPVLGLWHLQSRARTGMGICNVYHDP